MSTYYEQGRAFEYRIARFLEKRGYFVVRSAGSKGVADLVALRKDEVVLVQCTIGTKTKGERNALRAICDSIGAIPLLASREDRAIRWENLDGMWCLPWENVDEVR